jgi:hypothetical protein
MLRVNGAMSHPAQAGEMLIKSDKLLPSAFKINSSKMKKQLLALTANATQNAIHFPCTLCIPSS